MTTDPFRLADAWLTAATRRGDVPLTLKMHSAAAATISDIIRGGGPTRVDAKTFTSGAVINDPTRLTLYLRTLPDLSFERFQRIRPTGWVDVVRAVAVRNDTLVPLIGGGVKLLMVGDSCEWEFPGRRRPGRGPGQGPRRRLSTRPPVGRHP